MGISSKMMEQTNGCLVGLVRVGPPSFCFRSRFGPFLILSELIPSHDAPRPCRQSPMICNPPSSSSVVVVVVVVIIVVVVVVFLSSRLYARNFGGELKLKRSSSGKGTSATLQLSRHGTRLEPLVWPTAPDSIEELYSHVHL